jgi:uncharacterized protein YjaG (DUF416 family)
MAVMRLPLRRIAKERDLLELPAGPAIKDYCLSADYLCYDESLLRDALEQLPFRLALAFGAACAERLLPCYEEFKARTGFGDAEAMRGALEIVWNGVERGVDEEEIKSAIIRCGELIPEEDAEPWRIGQAEAADAVASIVFGLRALASDECQEVVWASRRGYEAVDHFVVEQCDMNMNTAASEETVLKSLLVQAELSRQQRDLRDLARGSAAGEDRSGLVARVRRRAHEDAREVFDRRLLPCDPR